MHVGYVRLRDGTVTNLNFQDIIVDGIPNRAIGPNEEFILRSGEVLVGKEDMDTSVQYKKISFSEGPTLIILTNQRLVLVRQPGGRQMRNAIHANIGDIEKIQKAIEITNKGYKEYVEVGLDEIQWKIYMGIVECVAKRNEINFFVFFDPRDKAEVFFADFLPKNKMRKKNIQAAEMLKSKSTVNADARIKTGEIPLSGYDEPMYCGKCGLKTNGTDCPKCEIDPRSFIEGKSKIPLSVMAGFYFLVVIAIPVMVGATIGLFISDETNTYVLGAAIGSVPFLGFFALLTYGKIRQVKEKRFIKCATCGRGVFPQSDRCVYCGEPISWFF